MKIRQNVFTFLSAPLVMALFFVFLYGHFCEVDSADASSTNASAKILSAPKAGYGHAKGIMSYKGEKKKGTPVYLIPVDAPPGIEWPKVETDEQGNWVALNLKPARYCPMVFFTESRRPLSFNEDAISNLCKEVKKGYVTDFGRQSQD